MRNSDSPKIKLTRCTAYLAGVIIGDGHISNSQKSKSDKSRDYRICIDLVDKQYLEVISKMIKSVIKTASRIKTIRIKERRKQRFYFQFRSKGFFYFFTDFLKIPSGRKSSIVSVPDKIKYSSNEIKRYFLAGLFDTDGGFRGKSLGFCTSSRILNEEVSSLLKNMGFRHSCDTWVNKLYQRSYYGIILNKSEIDNFLNSLPLQNKDKLVRIRKRFHAGMPERSNGTDDSNQLE